MESLVKEVMGQSEIWDYQELSIPLAQSVQFSNYQIVQKKKITPPRVGAQNFLCS